MEHMTGHEQHRASVVQWGVMQQTGLGSRSYIESELPTLSMRMTLATLQTGQDDVFEALDRLANERQHSDVQCRCMNTGRGAILARRRCS
jgi:hypothetical protein